MENYQPISGLEVPHTVAYCRNYAGSLVTENPGRGMRARGDLFQVGTANPTGVHSQKEFVWPYLGHRDCSQADVVYTVIDRRHHGCGNSPRVVRDRQLSSHGHH